MFLLWTTKAREVAHVQLLCFSPLLRNPKILVAVEISPASGWKQHNPACDVPQTESSHMQPLGFLLEREMAEVRQKASGSSSSELLG